LNERTKFIEQALSINSGQDIQQDLPSTKSWILNRGVDATTTSIDWSSKATENFRLEGLKEFVGGFSYCQTSDNRLFISGGDKN
jgi:hypothetical protein